MPLLEHNSTDAVSTSGRVFLVFYSSVDETGRLWCPDCRDVDDFVKKTFDASFETGLVIFVGQKPEWKSPDNQYRRSYNLQSIPTIVRYNNSKEEARLVEQEILQPGKLDQLLRE